MKLLSKEALLLGGIYLAVDTPFSLMGVEFITDLFLVGFIVSLIMLCFNKVPKFLSYTLEKYPKTSYYLCAVGWIPYVVAVAFLMFAGVGLFVEYTGAFTWHFILTLSIVSMIGAILSLTVALIRAKGKNRR